MRYKCIALYSVPQIRNRLKNWGHWKYLKLSDKQLNYMINRLHERAEDGKEKTAFRLGRKKIPSATLEKRFNDRPDLNRDEGESFFQLPEKIVSVNLDS